MIPNHMTVINQPYDNSLDKLIERREEERFGDIELFYGRHKNTPVPPRAKLCTIQSTPPKDVYDILKVLTKLYAVH
jgi:hypothetical protein